MSRERCDKPPPGEVHQVCAKNKLGFNFIFTLCGFSTLSLLTATVKVENIISSSSSSFFAFMLKVLWASFTALLHESNSALSAAVTCMQHFYNVKWILLSRERFAVLRTCRQWHDWNSIRHSSLHFMMERQLHTLIWCRTAIFSTGTRI